MEPRDSGALVTGGGSGLGRGIALALARAGADVIVADIDAGGAENVAREVRALGRQALAMRCDVSNPQGLETLADEAFAAFPHLTFIFNNAGIVVTGLATETSLKDLEWTFNVNTFGVWHGSMAFTRRFLALKRRGWICNTASENGLGAASIGTAAYTASKHAVVGMTDAFRAEYRDQVGFSVICPGIVRTRIWDAGRNRPAELGGAYQGNPINEKAIGYGLDPEEAGRLAVEAVRAEAFFVFTHRHVRDVAEQRWSEVAADIERQLPEGRTQPSLSTIDIQKKVLAELTSPDGATPGEAGVSA
jgi:meso-butanediol dehydrogenase / (S,S)-butanediol dehydrogenase / diacetyl reductase